MRKEHSKEGRKGDIYWNAFTALSWSSSSAALLVKLNVLHIASGFPRNSRRSVELQLIGSIVVGSSVGG